MSGKSVRSSPCCSNRPASLATHSPRLLSVSEPYAILTGMRSGGVVGATADAGAGPTDGGADAGLDGGVLALPVQASRVRPSSIRMPDAARCTRRPHGSKPISPLRDGTGRALRQLGRAV